MKRVLCFAIALLMLLLAACTTPAQPTEPTKPTPEPTTPPTAEPTIEPTVPPEVPDQPDLSWLPERTEELSYEEYFSEDRPYYHSSFWLVQTDGVMKGYTLKSSGAGLQVCTYDDNPWDDVDGEIVHTVPNSETLWEHSLVGTNGRVACIAEFMDVMAASGVKTAIYLVDLVTGDREIVIQDAVITSVSYCGDVLYYAVYKDDRMQIVRHYIPTGDEHFYPTNQTLVPMFSFNAPVSSDSPIIWWGTTEKMTDAIMKELQNPESRYRSHDRVPPYLWEMEEPWIYAQNNPIHWLCCALQEDTGYRTLYKCEIGTDGSVISEATGIVDSCWYGSDYGHDHYNPDADPPAKPTARKGSWKPFAEEMRSTGEDSSEFVLELHQNHVYEIDGNTFTLVTDMAVRSIYMTYADQSDSLNAYYGITPDNKFVRIYLDGQTPSVLYEGTDLKYFSSEGSYLLVLDGNSIIQLDVENQRYKTLFTHENLNYAYFDSDHVLYIELKSGLHVVAYLYDLSTGKLKETNYRL